MHGMEQLNVAVTGETGTGKSSFINTIRNLRARDPGAARVGVIETTLELQIFQDPYHPNLCFWDLPGVGSPMFPRESYLETINFRRFDVFVIVSRSRFKDNDLWLAKEITKLGLRFCFVRTCVDCDLENAQEDYPTDFSEERVLLSIKLDVEMNLSCVNSVGSGIFLINNKNPNALDFPLLKAHLVELSKDVPMTIWLRQEAHERWEEEDRQEALRRMREEIRISEMNRQENWCSLL